MATTLGTAALALIIGLGAGSWAPVPVHGPIENPAIARARLTLAHLFMSYNRHDVAGVLATLSRDAIYDDCDYRHHRILGLERQEVRGWLRTVWTEHDQMPADVAGATFTFPHRPVAGVDVKRTSDVYTPLVEQGLVFPLGAKIIFNSRGTRITGVALTSTPDCLAGMMPSGAQPQQEQQLAQRFLDAYNAHDLPGVLALFTDEVQYMDCDYATHTAVTLTGKDQVAGWLRQRFAENDQLTQSTILLDSWFSQPQNPPTTIQIRGVRTSTLLASRGDAKHPLVLVLHPDAAVQRIVLWDNWEQCTG